MRNGATLAFVAVVSTVVGAGMAFETTRDELPRIPVDLEDAITECMAFGDEFLDEVRASENEGEVVAKFHLAAAMWMRNAWNLWGVEGHPRSRVHEWFAARGVTIGDDISCIIMIVLWRRLTGRPERTDFLIRQWADGKGLDVLYGERKE